MLPDPDRAGSDRGLGSSGSRCARCDAPVAAPVPLIKSGDELGDDEASFRFLTPPLLLLLVVAEPGGFPTAAASFRPAVGGRPSGLYCVPVLTYAPPAIGDALSGWWLWCCFVGWEVAVLGALKGRRGELANEARGEWRFADEVA